MKNDLNSAFKNAKKENRPAMVSFTVAGDPNKKKSLAILKDISNLFKPKILPDSSIDLD